MTLYVDPDDGNVTRKTLGHTGQEVTQLVRTNGYQPSSSFLVEFWRIAGAGVCSDSMIAIVGLAQFELHLALLIRRSEGQADDSFVQGVLHNITLKQGEVPGLRFDGDCSLELAEVKHTY